jgi:hypothetical protein
MARLKKERRGDVVYLYAIEDIFESGSRKVHKIKSFGHSTPEKSIEAEIFLVNYNKIDEMAKLSMKQGMSQKELKKWLMWAGYLVTGILGSGVLQYLLKKYIHDEKGLFSPLS